MGARLLGWLPLLPSRATFPLAVRTIPALGEECRYQPRDTSSCGRSKGCWGSARPRGGSVRWDSQGSILSDAFDVTSWPGRLGHGSSYSQERSLPRDRSDTKAGPWRPLGSLESEHSAPARFSAQHRTSQSRHGAQAPAFSALALAVSQEHMLVHASSQMEPPTDPRHPFLWSHIPANGSNHWQGAANSPGRTKPYRPPPHSAARVPFSPKSQESVRASDQEP